ARVTRLIGVREESVQITHGNYSGAKDRLPRTPVVEVLEVRQGTTVFTEGTDYVVVGDEIDWSLSGAEPAPGSAYTVVYRYQADIEASVSEDRSRIYVSGLAEGTTFYVDYEYYLPRVDRIVLTREGDLKVLKGAPSEIPLPPEVTGGLSLARIRVEYARTPEIVPDFFRAFRMSDIQELFRRVRDIEYNLARLSLMEDARAQDPTTTKRGIFVDPFYDDDLRDAGYEQTAVISGGLLQPAVVYDVREIRRGAPVTLPFNPRLAISQEVGTRTRKVNRLTWHEPPPGKLSVSPQSFRFVVRETVTNQGTGTTFTSSTQIVTISEPVPVPSVTLSYEAEK
ncbi:MAG TPA: DUF4815 domain-containing protein, partial [Planctomycetaceae bacterium]|nr:DUF4815 domain-containing protein [Planctomycetaceae bacterium]